MRRYLLPSFLLALCGCYTMMPLEQFAEADVARPLPAPPPGKGLIYASAKLQSGAAAPCEIYLDGKKVGDLAHKNYLNFAVDPGEHKVIIFHQDAPYDARLRENAARAGFVVEPGGVYYIHGEWSTWKKGGGIFGGPLGEKEGRPLIARYRPGTYTAKPIRSLPFQPGPNQAPAPEAAAPAIRSDVDAPGYHRKERPGDFAVIVGIEEYKDLPRADFAERDAAAVRAHLGALGIPKRHIVALKGKDATRTGLTKYLEEWLPRNAGPDSTVFFYFSGHGAPDTGTGKAYLMPWDGDASFLKSTAYPIERLYASLGSLKAARVFVALDACFSGAGGRSVLARGARPLVTKVEQAVPRGERITLLTAASGEEITSTLEEEGHGIFTYYLLRGLNGEAKDARGSITAASLHRYLKPKVQDEARLQNREQTPSLHSASDFVIR